mmetsp:Transcript_125013/g.296615  ORF Transcript_125013/g.296615 Transcript_125013/m.296615 type:complete len:212 (+) Transcript_125013:61-696(+)
MEMWIQCARGGESSGTPSLRNAVQRSSASRRLGNPKGSKSRPRRGVSVRKQENATVHHMQHGGPPSISSWIPLPCMGKMTTATVPWQHSWAWMTKPTVSSSRWKGGRSDRKTTICSEGSTKTSSAKHWKANASMSSRQRSTSWVPRSPHLAVYAWTSLRLEKFFERCFLAAIDFTGVVSTAGSQRRPHFALWTRSTSVSTGPASQALAAKD